MKDVFHRLRAALADRYTIERELGSGGMATVYLAEDLKLHRKVALKVLAPELAATLGSDRFLREIDIAAKLTHPHILPLHDCGVADGFLYYVMPYIAGETLRGRIYRERLETGEFPSDVNYQGYLGVLAARRADRQRALRMSSWLEELERPFLFGINTLWRARIAALLGEPQETMMLLRAALEQGLTVYGNGPFLWLSRVDVHWLHRDIDLESLRDYAPFQEFMRPKG